MEVRRRTQLFVEIINSVTINSAMNGWTRSLVLSMYFSYDDVDTTSPTLS